MGSNTPDYDLENHACGFKIQPFISAPMLNVDVKQPPLTLGEILGVDELMSLEVWQASVGEILGTAVLVFMLDTIIISTINSDVKMASLIISVLVAVTITILLLAVAPISGGHMNPIISFSAALVGLISISRAAVYIIAQCLGAVLGALAVRAVIAGDAFSMGGCKLRAIVTGPNGKPIYIGLETGPAFWMEFICCFIFLFASIWMAYDYRQAKELGRVKVFTYVGAVIGLLVLVSSSATGKKGYSGAGINPARCFGPAVVGGGHLWDGHWVFWIAPAMACVGFYFYTKVIPRDHHQFKGYDHDILNVIKTALAIRSN